MKNHSNENAQPPKTPFKKGDIFFSVNHGGTVHNGISLVQYMAGYQYYDIVHAGIVVFPDLIVELGGKGIELNLIDSIQDGQFKVFRGENQAVTELMADLAYGLFEAGKNYAHIKALFSVCVKNKVMSCETMETLQESINKLEFPNALYCSEFVTLLYEMAQRIVGESTINPNDCDSTVMNPSAFYQCLANSSDFHPVELPTETDAQNQQENLSDRLSLLDFLHTRIAKLMKEEGYRGQSNALLFLRDSVFKLMGAKHPSLLLLKAALDRLDMKLAELTGRANDNPKLSQLPGIFNESPNKAKNAVVLMSANTMPLPQ